MTSFLRMLADLLSFDCTDTVLVKEAKGCLSALLTQQRGPVNLRCEPLLEIYRIPAIRVGVSQHYPPSQVSAFCNHR